jgi:hypothetical protein
MTGMYEGVPVVLWVVLVLCAFTFLWAAWSAGRAKVAEEAAEEAKASAEASAEAARKALEAASNAQQAKAWGGHLAGQVTALEKRLAELEARPATEAKPAPAAEPVRHTGQYPTMRPPALPAPAQRSAYERLPSLVAAEDRVDRSGLTAIGVAPPAAGSWQPPGAPKPVVASRAGR